MFAEVMTAQFWWALLAIIWADIILSGDNAVVIALAARSLPEKQQKQAVFWGAFAAVAMRCMLTIVAVQLLTYPLLKLIGGVLLLWIAVKLLVPQKEGHDNIKPGSNLAGAIKTILIADFVMSLDNVIAVAAAAHGSYFLLILGLAISIPFVIFGAKMLMRIMERYPIIIVLGSGILGWVAGKMIVTDPVLKHWVEQNAKYLPWVVSTVAAVTVVIVGKWLAARERETRTVEFAAEESKA
jgi:YjbE family integral membrane protein